MKKLYYKRQIPQEEKPILQLLERSHTLLHALANEANSEWQELTSRTRSSDMASTGSYRENFLSLGSDEGTPSLVIKDTDLASSWIYSKKKAAANSVFESVSSEPMSPARTMSKQDSGNDAEISPQLEFRRIPIAPRTKSKSSCCCYMTILLIIFVCFLGILTSVGGILYLEIFTTGRKSPTVDLSATPPQASVSTTTHFEQEHKQKPSTEVNNADAVTTGEPSSSPLETSATVDMKLFQARRGKWSNDDSGEFSERTLESTTVSNSVNKDLLSTYPETNVNDKTTNSNTGISGRITDAEKDLITDKATKITNEFKTDDLSRKSTFTTTTTNRIVKNANSKNTTQAKSNQEAVNLNLFQARRGNWGNDDDDHDEFSERTPELTPTDNLQSIHEDSSTYSETNMNDKSSNSKINIRDRIPDSQTGLITDKTTKITNELAAGSSKKSIFTTATTDRITKIENRKNTTDAMFNPVTFEDDIVDPSVTVAKTEDFAIDSSTTVTLQFNNSPEINTIMSRSFGNAETFSEVSLSKIPFDVTTVKLDGNKITLPTTSKLASKSSREDNLLETTHLNEEKTFTSATSLKFSPNFVQSTRKPGRNRLDGLQEIIASSLKNLQRLDTRGTLPQSRTKQFSSLPKSPIVRQIAEDAAASVFPALANKEREKYLDKLRDIYFNSQ